MPFTENAIPIPISKGSKKTAHHNEMYTECFSYNNVFQFPAHFSKKLEFS